MVFIIIIIAMIVGFLAGVWGTWILIAEKAENNEPIGLAGKVYFLKRGIIKEDE